MSTLKERIGHFISYKNMTTTSFEKAVGLSNGAYSKMGENTRQTTLKKICAAYPELSLEWIKAGVGDMLNGTETLPKRDIDNKSIMILGKHAINDNITETAYFYKDLPTTAGDAELFFSQKEPSGVIRMSSLHGAKYFFPVQGCSMLPRIKNGDWVGVIETERDCIIDPDKIYMIITRDNQRMIKHIAGVDNKNNFIICSSDNENYLPFHVPFDMIVRIYQVVCHFEVL